MAKQIKTIADLTPDSANVNKGTERGHYLIDYSITELGAGRSILADADGVVVAGNKTLEVAADHQLPVRVVQTDGSELVVVQRTDLRLTGKGAERDRARKLAIADNRASEVGYSADVEIVLEHAQSGVDLSAMYRQGELDALMETLTPNELDDLEGDQSTQLTGAGDEQEEEFRGVYALQEDVIFPSKNAWGIPDLLSKMCSDQIPDTVFARQPIEDESKTLYVFQTAKFEPSAAKGVLAFYVDDWRFENVWLDAVRVVEGFKSFGWSAIVSPDFSVWRDDPMVIQAWNIYRSRWCARYWQEAGLKVIPSLNWSDERSFDFAYLGIPKNLPVVSVQCRTTRSRKGKEFFGKGLASSIEELTPQNVIVYGGAEHRQWIEPLLPATTCYHWLESWTSLQRKSVFNQRGANENESAN